MIYILHFAIDRWLLLFQLVHIESIDWFDVLLIDILLVVTISYWVGVNRLDAIHYWSIFFRYHIGWYVQLLLLLLLLLLLVLPCLNSWLFVWILLSMPSSTAIKMLIQILVAAAADAYVIPAALRPIDWYWTCAMLHRSMLHQYDISLYNIN